MTASRLSRLHVRWTDNPKRSLTIGLTAAAIGLVLAGFSLFTARGTSSGAIPAADIALVNQRPILMSDYEAQLEAEFGVPPEQATPEQRHKVLEDMIREELFVQRGLELDEPSTDPDTRAALVAAVETQAVVDATSQVPADSALLDYYARNKDRYSTIGRITLADYVTADAKAGEAAAKELAAGGDVATVMARHGLTDSAAVKGEEFYFAAKIHLGDRLFAEARALPSGAQSRPILEGGKTHILAVKSNTVPIPRAFEEARVQVGADYRNDLQKKLQAGEYRYLRDKAEILIAKGFK